MKFFKKSKSHDNYNTQFGDDLANEIIPVLKEIMLTGQNYLNNGNPIKEFLNGEQIKHTSLFDSFKSSPLITKATLELYNLYDYSFLFWKYRYKDDIRIKIYKIVNGVVVPVNGNRHAQPEAISKEKYIEILNLRNFRFSKGDDILNNIILKMKDLIKKGDVNSFKYQSNLYTNSIGKFEFGVSSREGGFDVDYENVVIGRPFKFKRENVVFLKYGYNYPISESKFSEYLSLVAEINKIKNDAILEEKFDLLETQTSENFKLSTNYLEKDINTLSEDGLTILKAVLLKESEDRVREYVLKTLESKLSRNLSYFLLELSREFKGLDKNVNLYDIHKEIKEIWGVAPADDPSPFASGLTGPVGRGHAQN